MCVHCPPFLSSPRFLPPSLPPSLPPFAVQAKRVFASLANGTLCVFARKSIQLKQESIGDATFDPEGCTISCDEQQFLSEAKDWADPLILLLGKSRKAAKCMVFVGQSHLWCGCGNTITVVDIVNMRVLKSIPVFVKRMALVNELVCDGDKVWGVGRQLSCVMEWDAKNFDLLHVFNCNIIDPTNDIIISDPKLIEDLYDSETRPAAASVSDPTGEGVQSPSGFTVENNPKGAAPFSQSSTRRTLRGLHGRKRAVNIKDNIGSARVTSTRDLVRHRHKGSTRTTSLLIMGRTLWVARGMGDILIIDIGGKESHGRVLLRLAMEDSEKFGNKSYHKLVCVAGEYVVSSQWLEPVDIGTRSATIGGGTPSTPDMPRAGASRQHAADDSEGKAHQAITIWSAWNHENISRFMERRSTQLMQEMDNAV